MLDIKLIRENIKEVKAGVKSKGVNIDIDKILELDKTIRKRIKILEEIKAKQNKISKLGKLTREQLDQAKTLKQKIKDGEPRLESEKKEFNELMLQVPNPPLKDVPVGVGEEGNLVIKSVGKKPKFDFEPKNYLTIAEELDIIDVKRAAKVSGTRFGYLKGGAALLEFALIQLALDIIVKNRFIPIIPPVLVKPEMMKGMGYTERGEKEIYQLANDNLYLIGTAEQAIGPMHSEEVFNEKDLPKRYVAFSSCFRREAGSYGKDTKGILRVHQFDKVEMFSFCKTEESDKEHKLILSLEEKLMKLLKIPYQVVQIGTGDLGDPAAAKFDIEAWLPGQNEYRETHSASTCTDFQARRLKIRYRQARGQGTETKFVHTVNGTAFAIGRTIIAIIENYQQKDGSIKVPKVLQKYTKIKEIK